MQQALEGEIKQQRIAPLLLITFAENAFKHGAKGNTGAAHISLVLQVKEDGICLRVQNTRGEVDETIPEEYRGVGLKNARRRLALLYPGKHTLTIHETETDFTVILQLTT